MADSKAAGTRAPTRVLPISPHVVTGHFAPVDSIHEWKVTANESQLEPYREAAEQIKHSNVPVAFPTETVYGLGADATRNEAARGIYLAKGRPADNPLIIHVCDLVMLRGLLRPSSNLEELKDCTGFEDIPPIYHELLKRFWPGPLTILLPNPPHSKLASQVTCGLPTFGVRMPAAAHALTLIKMAGVPIAAPSANASTRPSCTSAAHVLHDLKDRINLILDGGPSEVGVESTIVDGLSEPPCLLRPGGISLDEIRRVPGWQNVVKGYKDSDESSSQDDKSHEGSLGPRAPGMKYKHYSPKARVVLYEAGHDQHHISTLAHEPSRIIAVSESRDGNTETSDALMKIGIITTKHWSRWMGFDGLPAVAGAATDVVAQMHAIEHEAARKVIDETTVESHSALPLTRAQFWATNALGRQSHVAELLSINLGSDLGRIAQGLFAALRELDEHACSIIYVEGVESQNDLGGAIMNRLRKAASVIEQ